MRITLITLCIIFLSCNSEQGSREYRFSEQLGGSYSSLINNKKIELRSNLDIKLVNQAYPLHFQIYENKGFYYFLQGLDEGEGTWTIKDNILVLTAKTPMFDLIVNIEEVSIGVYQFKFIDRHGPQVLPLEVIK